MAKLLSASTNAPYFGASSLQKSFKSYEETPFEGHYTEEINQNMEKVRESFFRNPQFQTVYKNFNYKKTRIS